MNGFPRHLGGGFRRLVQPRAFRAVALSALIAGLASCSSDQPSGLGPGWRVSLVSPFGDEGAAIIEVVAPSHAFQADEGVIVTRRIGDRVQVAVFRGNGGAISFLATSDDESAPASPQVLQVADPVSNRRPSLDGYSVTIEPLP